MSSFKDALPIILKLVIQIWLLGLFLHFLGLPALTRFYEQKVVVVKSSRESDGTPIPAVTIAIRGPVSGNGWRQKQGLKWQFSKFRCMDA